MSAFVLCLFLYGLITQGLLIVCVCVCWCVFACNVHIMAFVMIKCFLLIVVRISSHEQLQYYYMIGWPYALRGCEILKALKLLGHATCGN